MSETGVLIVVRYYHIVFQAVIRVIKSFIEQMSCVNWVHMKGLFEISIIKKIKTWKIMIKNMTTWYAAVEIMKLYQSIQLGIYVINRFRIAPINFYWRMFRGTGENVAEIFISSINSLNIILKRYITTIYMTSKMIEE